MSKRTARYRINDDGDQVFAEKPSHSRTNTNTKLVSSDDKNKQDEMSSGGSSFADVREVESSQEDPLALKQRQHTMKVQVGRNDEDSDEERQEKGKNGLLRALNKRKAQSILELNAATNVIPEVEVQGFNEALGLNEEQMEYYRNTKFLFRYNDNWRTYWDLFIMLLAIWNCFIIPVEVSFEPKELEHVVFVVINALIDFMFLVDIIIVFRTSYVDSYTGEEVLYANMIACNYLKGRFWIDLLATIPFDILGMLILGGSTTELQLFGILKLIRIARLSKIISYLNVKEDTKLILKLVKLIFFLMMYLHLCGCVWFFLVKQDEEWLPPLDYVYVTTTFFQDTTNYKYWMSIYHAVLVLTGNDIGPRFEDIQVIFCLVFVTFGAIVNAYIFGELVVLVAVMNAKTAAFVQKLDICNTAMKNQSLPKDLQHEVIGYLTYTQALLDSQQELETFLSLISPSLKEKVIKHIFSEVLKENEIFRGDDQLIDYLTRKLDTKIYQPEEHIVSQGEEGDKIYFIAKGGCNVYIRNRHNTKVKVNVLIPGDLFGEVAILNGCRRTATVTANNYSTIAHLTKETFNNIFNKNPEALKTLKDGRKKYQDEWKVFMKDNLKYFDYVKNCSERTIEELTYYLREEMYEAGDVIFKAGQQVDRAYFIANGEVDIIVKIGKKEVMLDCLYQSCNIGEYGVLGDYRHTFTCKAKKNATHMIYITKDAINACRDRFNDFYKEIEYCKDYLETSGLPLVDFRLYRNLDNKMKTVEILKLAIARVMRINDALEANYSPEEITEILQTIQIRVFGEGDDDESNLQKNSNRMLQEVLQRLAAIHQENSDLKLQLAKFDKKVGRIEKSVSTIKSEVTGNPNTYVSQTSSSAAEEASSEEY